MYLVKKMSTYLCIDLKTFYASVECVERGLDPFKTKLVVANPTRGKGAVCLAVTPKMKSLGVRNRCRIYEIPSNIKYIVAMPRMKLYITYASEIRELYLKYVAEEDLHIYSIDEAFLDITDYRIYKTSPKNVAKKILDDMYDTFGLTATCGIGTNMYLSKIALDLISKSSKDNIGYLDEETFIRDFSYRKPLTDFWQIGNGIATRLNKLGIHTLYELRMHKEQDLYDEFGSLAEIIIDHAYGKESCTIKDIKEYKPKSKSTSSSQILFKNYKYEEARIVLEEMIDNKILELYRGNYLISSIGLYIGYTKDTIPSTKASIKLKVPTRERKVIFAEILSKYDKIASRIEHIRRIGISFGGLVDRTHEQMSLFPEDSVDSTLNSIKLKYGVNSILKGISYLECGTQRYRNTLIGGHNAE